MSVRLLFTALISLSFGALAMSADEQPRQLIAKNSLGQWEEVGYGGQGIVEVNDRVLSIGAGDPITAVRWKGKIGDGPNDFPASNYTLSYETRRVLGGDFFGTVTFPVGDDVCSLVVGGWSGGVTGLSSLNGDDAANNNTTDYTAFENNIWYKFELTVTPELITAKLDDAELFAPVSVPDHQIGIRVEMEPCRPLGFASFHSIGEIRNVTVVRHQTATKN